MAGKNKPTPEQTKKAKYSRAKGRRMEAKSQKMLEDLGYAIVRAAGSHGPFDLVAFNDRTVTLIQVKTNAWPRGHEIEAMRLFPAPNYCRKLVHRWDDGKRTPIVKRIQDFKEVT